MSKILIYFSHAWKENNEYYRIKGLLDGDGYLQYEDYFDSSFSSLETPYDQRQKYFELKNKLEKYDYIVIPMSYYSNSYEKHWINVENKVAQDLNIPVVVIAQYRRSSQNDIPKLNGVNYFEITCWKFYDITHFFENTKK